jgi:phytoene synthase
LDPLRARRPDDEVRDEIVALCAEMIRRGSRSFFAASRILDRPTRKSVHMLYAWCRHCDDRIDAQRLGWGGPSDDREASRQNLQALTLDTRRALAGDEAIEDPIFLALRLVVTRHAIPERYPLDLLAGFSMDVEARRYEEIDDVLEYCYHVAGVVGVMMAYVMGVDDDSTLDRASDLGLAFQMTNIARDVVEDARGGRVYLPRAWLAEAGIDHSELLAPDRRAALSGVVARLLAEADRYYDSSIYGVARLRFRHAWAIGTARRVYREIGRLVASRGPAAWDRRAVIGAGRKLALALAALADAGRSRGLRDKAPPARAGLWTRPR